MYCRPCSVLLTVSLAAFSFPATDDVCATDLAMYGVLAESIFDSAVGKVSRPPDASVNGENTPSVTR